MDLEKIEDRLTKATEHSGKWYLSETEHGGLGIFRDPDKYEPFYPILIAEIADPDIAEFLCFAPEDTRSLINRVQRLEQELEAMKALHVVHEHDTGMLPCFRDFYCTCQKENCCEQCGRTM